MITLFIVVCCVLLVIFAAIFAIAMFINTAFFLLPWTIPATGAGAIFGYATGTMAPMSDRLRPLVGGFVALASIMGFGYAGMAVFRPENMQNPIVLFPVDLDDLAKMTPIHMGISALIGAVGVGIAITLVTMKSKKRAVLELNESSQVNEGATA